MKKTGLIIAGSLLALALVGCSSKEGKEGLLTLKDKQAYEFDQMSKKTPFTCHVYSYPHDWTNHGKTTKVVNKLSNSCNVFYSKFAKQIEDKFSVSNVTPQDIADAKPTIEREATKYVNNHISELMG
jgi:hypothetical protein